MKYFIRAIKAFLHFSILITVIIGVLILFNIVPSDISTLFKDGYDSVWQIAVILAVISAVYPKAEYMKRNLAVEGGLSRNGDKLAGIMKSRSYEVEDRGAGKLTFRLPGMSARLMRKNEDRITFTETPEGIAIEGLRKDVVRIASAIEYQLQQDQSLK